MENNIENIGSTPANSAQAISSRDQTCPTCHQPVKPEYYFCPNCGAKLNAPPLSTSVWTQTWIYAFSIILPWICYIMVTKWPAAKYFRSKDKKARMIGIIAWTLMILSTLLTIWLAYIWTVDTIQSSMNAVNMDMSGGGF